MCEYCKESKDRKDIDDNGEIKVRLNEGMGNNLEIDYYHYGTKVGRYIPIVFCPMCGRLVNEDVLKAIKKSVNTTEQMTNPIMSEIATPIFEEPLQEISKVITAAVKNHQEQIINQINMRGGMY